MQPTVLIADDSIFVRDLIRHYLDRLGFRVVAEAENPAQALTLFRALKPDFVTLDVVMPPVGGIDALTAFRVMRQAEPRVPILIVSAMQLDETRDLFLGEGALDYLVKPFNKRCFDGVKPRLEALFPTLGGRPPKACSGAQQS